MRCAGHVESILEIKNQYKILAGNLKGSGQIWDL